MPTLRTRIATIGLAALLTPSALLRAQGEARRYVILRENGELIDPRRDYFSLAIAQGWVSTKHTFLQRLLSTDSKSTVLLESAVTFFDGQKIENASTFSNTDTRRNVGRAWGVQPTLFERLPGDAEPQLSIQLAVYREDNVGRVLGALDASKAALPADLVASPALGYARAVSGTFKTLFGADRTSYPFVWQGAIRAASPAITAAGMREHYVVLVAPRDPADQQYRALDARQLAYDEGSQRLTYAGAAVTDWSYAVVAVRKAARYDIASLMGGGSSAPWAVLGTNVFRAIPTGDAGSADELRTMARGLVAQLNNMTDLLKRELRFSAFSRGEAIAGLATRVRSQIKRRCDELQVAAAQCPTNDFDQIAENSLASFGIPVLSRAQVLSAGLALDARLFRAGNFQ